MLVWKCFLFHNRDYASLYFANYIWNDLSYWTLSLWPLILLFKLPFGDRTFEIEVSSVQICCLPFSEPRKIDRDSNYSNIAGNSRLIECSNDGSNCFSWSHSQHRNIATSSKWPWHELGMSGTPKFIWYALQQYLVLEELVYRVKLLWWSSDLSYSVRKYPLASPLRSTHGIWDCVLENRPQ